MGDQAIAKSAAVSSRYNLNSLRGIISDIYMLSQSDYIVCTFSSQVCRIAYEIQQQRYNDFFCNLLKGFTFILIHHLVFLNLTLFSFLDMSMDPGGTNL